MIQILPLHAHRNIFFSINKKKTNVTLQLASLFTSKYIRSSLFLFGDWRLSSRFLKRNDEKSHWSLLWFVCIISLFACQKVKINANQGGYINWESRNCFVKASEKIGLGRVFVIVCTNLTDILNNNSKDNYLSYVQIFPLYCL